jgi:integrase
MSLPVDHLPLLHLDDATLVFPAELLRKDTPQYARETRLGDDIWPIFGLDHGAGKNRPRLNFARVPSCLVPQAKVIFWAMINVPKPSTVETVSGTLDAEFPAPGTIYVAFGQLSRFYRWAENSGHTLSDPSSISTSLLERYGDDLASSELGRATKENALKHLCLIYHFSLLAAPAFRWPQPPWLGKPKRTAKILGPAPRGGNTTRPIAPEVMAVILPLCIDLISAPSRQLKKRGFTNTDVAAAAMLVLVYLTGMRPLEARSLPRACFKKQRLDTGSIRFEIRGLSFKGERDLQGRAVTAGVPREQPWVTVETGYLAAKRAAEVAEIIRPGSAYLFPAGIDTRQHGADRAVKPSTVAARIRRLLTKLTGDPTAGDGRPINLSRLRRTLAWHIARRPGGEIALGVQYGHVKLLTGQGYASREKDGLHDMIDFEELEATLEHLDKLTAQVDAGSAISGPAAKSLKAKLTSFKALFKGTVQTDRDAKKLKAAGLAGVHDSPRGYAICVYDPDKAACHPQNASGSERRSPNIDRCKSSCANVARTDEHIAQLDEHAIERRALAASGNYPEPINERLLADATNCERLVSEHRKAKAATR